MVLQEEVRAPVVYTHMDAQTPMAPFAVGVAHGKEDDFGTTDSVGAISLWIVDR